MECPTEFDLDEIDPAMRKEFDKWKAMSINKQKAKLADNLEKRRAAIEQTVNKTVETVRNEQSISLMANAPPFAVCDQLYKEASTRMTDIVASWTGVEIGQCREVPDSFKKYWRVADNWWNRQKGKWFGDLLFWPLLHRDLHQYCEQIAVSKQNKNALYSVLLCALMHSEVSFKKSRPLPIIFDLALDKSSCLSDWLKSMGEQNGLLWNPSTKSPKQTVQSYTKEWSKKLKDMHMKLRHVQSASPSSSIPVENNVRCQLQSAQSAPGAPLRSRLLQSMLPTQRPSQQQLYYILQMKDNKPLPVHLLAALSQCCTIVTHVASAEDTNDTNETATNSSTSTSTPPLLAGSGNCTVGYPAPMLSAVHQIKTAPMLSAMQSAFVESPGQNHDIRTSHNHTFDATQYHQNPHVMPSVVGNTYRRNGTQNAPNQNCSVGYLSSINGTNRQFCNANDSNAIHMDADQMHSNTNYFQLNPDIQSFDERSVHLPPASPFPFTSIYDDGEQMLPYDGSMMSISNAYEEEDEHYANF